MSSWTVPITFTAASILTAAQMNTEVRDHLNFLKGFADLITGSTTADTGTVTNISITRTAFGDAAFLSLVSGDAQARFVARAGGSLEWGSGAAATDTSLYRSTVGLLKTDTDLQIGANMYGSATGLWEFTEIADPGVSAANKARLYCKDNGAGKTLLVCVFSSGAVQTIATQP